MHKVRIRTKVIEMLGIKNIVYMR